MIHADAGVAAQYIYEPDEDPLKTFISELISFFCEGTVIVPAFSYSATKGEVFDVQETPSDVGLFAEKFRLAEGIDRSQHPIFSVSHIGRRQGYFVNSRLDDCSGRDGF